MTAILHFMSDLALVNVEDKTKSQVLTGSVTRRYHFFCVFGNGSSVCVPLEVWVDFGAQ